MFVLFNIIFGIIISFIDKSGWWVFIILIPFIGWIWLLILMLTEGTSGSNQYGSDSK